MDSPDGSGPHSGPPAGLARLERSLRRALATAESEETRYHLRTALQYLEVLRDRSADTGRTQSAPSDGR
ncbi:hypothetical protein [Halobaculum lipolyticum]|uniref:Uncharacterized protein n=1 Tax=Halobaculum lipolyticum TaxID=3032001 RepID=A0ABD5W648_9EURY|nr:hypothetical protein [Halobaculum sp. DT31]